MCIGFAVLLAAFTLRAQEPLKSADKDLAAIHDSRLATFNWPLDDAYRRMEGPTMICGLSLIGSAFPLPNNKRFPAPHGNGAHTSCESSAWNQMALWRARFLLTWFRSWVQPLMAFIFYEFSGLGHQRSRAGNSCYGEA